MILPEIHRLLTQGQLQYFTEAMGDKGFGYLILRLSLEKEHIDDGELLDISMPFEFLTDSRADCRYGDDKTIRLNDFGGLPHHQYCDQLTGCLRRAAIVGRGR